MSNSIYNAIARNPRYQQGISAHRGMVDYQKQQSGADLDEQELVQSNRLTQDALEIYRASSAHEEGKLIGSDNLYSILYKDDGKGIEYFDFVKLPTTDGGEKMVRVSFLKSPDTAEEAVKGTLYEKYFNKDASQGGAMIRNGDTEDVRFKQSFALFGSGKDYTRWSQNEDLLKYIQNGGNLSMVMKDNYAFSDENKDHYKDAEERNRVYAIGKDYESRDQVVSYSLTSRDEDGNIIGLINPYDMYDGILKNTEGYGDRLLDNEGVKKSVEKIEDPSFLGEVWEGIKSAPRGVATGIKTLFSDDTGLESARRERKEQGWEVSSLFEDSAQAVGTALTLTENAIQFGGGLFRDTFGNDGYILGTLKGEFGEAGEYIDVFDNSVNDAYKTVKIDIDEDMIGPKAFKSLVLNEDWKELESIGIKPEVIDNLKKTLKDADEKGLKGFRLRHASISDEFSDGLLGGFGEDTVDLKGGDKAVNIAGEAIFFFKDVIGNGLKWGAKKAPKAVKWAKEIPFKKILGRTVKENAKVVAKSVAKGTKEIAKKAIVAPAKKAIRSVKLAKDTFVTIAKNPKSVVEAMKSTRVVSHMDGILKSDVNFVKKGAYLLGIPVKAATSVTTKAAKNFTVMAFDAWKYGHAVDATAYSFEALEDQGKRLQDNGYNGIGKVLEFIGGHNPIEQTLKESREIMNIIGTQFLTSDNPYLFQVGLSFNKEAGLEVEKEIAAYNNEITRLGEEAAKNPSYASKYGEQIDKIKAERSRLVDKAYGGNRVISAVMQTAVPMMLQYTFARTLSRGSSVSKITVSPLVVLNKITGGIVYGGMAYDQVFDKDMSDADKMTYAISYASFEAGGEGFADDVFALANKKTVQRIISRKGLGPFIVDGTEEIMEEIIETKGQIAVGENLSRFVAKAAGIRNGKGFISDTLAGLKAVKGDLSIKIGKQFFDEAFSEGSQSLLEDAIVNEEVDLAKMIKNASMSALLGGVMGLTVGQASIKFTDFVIDIPTSAYKATVGTKKKGVAVESAPEEGKLKAAGKSVKNWGQKFVSEYKEIQLKKIQRELDQSINSLVPKEAGLQLVDARVLDVNGDYKEGSSEYKSLNTHFMAIKAGRKNAETLSNYGRNKETVTMTFPMKDGNMVEFQFARKSQNTFAAFKMKGSDEIKLGVVVRDEELREIEYDEIADSETGMMDISNENVSYGRALTFDEITLLEDKKGVLEVGKEGGVVVKLIDHDPRSPEEVVNDNIGKELGEDVVDVKGTAVDKKNQPAKDIKSKEDVKKAAPKPVKTDDKSEKKKPLTKKDVNRFIQIAKEYMNNGTFKEGTPDEIKEEYQELSERQDIEKPTVEKKEKVTPKPIDSKETETSPITPTEEEKVEAKEEKTTGAAEDKKKKTAPKPAEVVEKPKKDVKKKKVSEKELKDSKAKDIDNKTTESKEKDKTKKTDEAKPVEVKKKQETKAFKKQAEERIAGASLHGNILLSDILFETGSKDKKKYEKGVQAGITTGHELFHEWFRTLSNEEQQITTDLIIGSSTKLKEIYNKKGTLTPQDFKDVEEVGAEYSGIKLAKLGYNKQEVEKKNKKLWEKIKSFFSDLLSSFKKEWGINETKIKKVFNAFSKWANSGKLEGKDAGTISINEIAPLGFSIDYSSVDLRKIGHKEINNSLKKEEQQGIKNNIDRNFAAVVEGVTATNIDQKKKEAWEDLKKNAQDPTSGVKGFYSEEYDLERQLRDIDKDVRERITSPDTAKLLKRLKASSDEEQEMYKKRMLIEINNNREEIHKGWIKYLDSTPYDEGFKFLVLRGILREKLITNREGKRLIIKFSRNTKNLPDTVSQEKVGYILGQMEESDNRRDIPKDWYDAGNIGKKEGEVTDYREEWVLYQGVENSNKLKDDTQNTGWCISQGSAPTYLRRGDFWIYFDNKGQASIAIAHDANGILEKEHVRGKGRGQSLEPEFTDIALEKIEKEDIKGAEASIHEANLIKELNEVEKGDIEKAEEILKRYDYKYTDKKAGVTISDSLVTVSNFDEITHITSKTGYGSNLAEFFPGLKKERNIDKDIKELKRKDSTFLDRKSLVITGITLDLPNITRSWNITLIDSTLNAPNITRFWSITLIDSTLNAPNITEGGEITLTNSTLNAPNIIGSGEIILTNSTLKAPNIIGIWEITLTNSTLNAPNITKSEGITLTDSTLNAPNITKSGKILLENSTLDLPNITGSGDVRLVNSTLNAPNITKSGKILLANSTLDLPKVTGIRDITLINSTLDLPNVTESKEIYLANSTLDLPNVTESKEIYLANSTLNAPNITKSSDITLTDSTLDLPNVTRSGEITLTNSTLNALKLPNQNRLRKKDLNTDLSNKSTENYFDQLTEKISRLGININRVSPETLQEISDKMQTTKDFSDNEGRLVEKQKPNPIKAVETGLETTIKEKLLKTKALLSKDNDTQEDDEGDSMLEFKKIGKDIYGAWSKTERVVYILDKLYKSEGNKKELIKTLVHEFKHVHSSELKKLGISEDEQLKAYAMFTNIFDTVTDENGNIREDKKVYLNEAMTKYIEDKIVDKRYNKETRALKAWNIWENIKLSLIKFFRSIKNRIISDPNKKILDKMVDDYEKWLIGGSGFDKGGFDSMYKQLVEGMKNKDVKIVEISAADLKQRSGLELKTSLNKDELILASKEYEKNALTSGRSNKRKIAQMLKSTREEVENGTETIENLAAFYNGIIAQEEEVLAKRYLQFINDYPGLPFKKKIYYQRFFESVLKGTNTTEIGEVIKEIKRFSKAPFKDKLFEATEESIIEIGASVPKLVKYLTKEMVDRNSIKWREGERLEPAGLLQIIKGIASRQLEINENYKERDDFYYIKESIGTIFDFLESPGNIKDFRSPLKEGDNKEVKFVLGHKAALIPNAIIPKEYEGNSSKYNVVKQIKKLTDWTEANLNELSNKEVVSLSYDGNGGVKPVIVTVKKSLESTLTSFMKYPQDILNINLFLEKFDKGYEKLDSLLEEEYQETSILMFNLGAIYHTYSNSVSKVKAVDIQKKEEKKLFLTPVKKIASIMENEGFMTIESKDLFEGLFKFNLLDSSSLKAKQEKESKESSGLRSVIRATLNKAIEEYSLISPSRFIALQAYDIIQNNKERSDIAKEYKKIIADADVDQKEILKSLKDHLLRKETDIEWPAIAENKFYLEIGEEINDGIYANFIETGKTGLKLRRATTITGKEKAKDDEKEERAVLNRPAKAGLKILKDNGIEGFTEKDVLREGLNTYGFMKESVVFELRKKGKAKEALDFLRILDLIKTSKSKEISNVTKGQDGEVIDILDNIPAEKQTADKDSKKYLRLFRDKVKRILESSKDKEKEDSLLDDLAGPLSRLLRSTSDKESKDNLEILWGKIRKGDYKREEIQSVLDNIPSEESTAKYKEAIEKRMDIIERFKEREVGEKIKVLEILKRLEKRVGKESELSEEERDLEFSEKSISEKRIAFAEWVLGEDTPPIEDSFLASLSDNKEFVRSYKEILEKNLEHSSTKESLLNEIVTNTADARSYSEMSRDLERLRKLKPEKNIKVKELKARIDKFTENLSPHVDEEGRFSGINNIVQELSEMLSSYEDEVSGDKWIGNHDMELAKEAITGYIDSLVDYIGMLDERVNEINSENIGLEKEYLEVSKEFSKMPKDDLWKMNRIKKNYEDNKVSYDRYNIKEVDLSDFVIEMSGDLYDDFKKSLNNSKDPKEEGVVKKVIHNYRKIYNPNLPLNRQIVFKKEGEVIDDNITRGIENIVQREMLKMHLDNYAVIVYSEIDKFFKYKTASKDSAEKRKSGEAIETLEDPENIEKMLKSIIKNPKIKQKRKAINLLEELLSNEIVSVINKKRGGAKKIIKESIMDSLKRGFKKFKEKTTERMFFESISDSVDEGVYIKPPDKEIDLAMQEKAAEEEYVDDEDAAYEEDPMEEDPMDYDTDEDIEENLAEEVSDEVKCA